MSHFYRMQMHRDGRENRPLAYVEDIDFNMKRFREMFGLKPYEFKFEEIPLNPPWPQCQLFRAPLIEDKFMQLHAVFHIEPGIELPDMWIDSDFPFVSERTKEVIEAFDDFGHQFEKIDVFDEAQNKINKTPYYRMNIRRFFKIEESKGKVENRTFSLAYKEDKYLLTVQKNDDLKTKLSTVPLWRHFKIRDIMYLSEEMLRAFKDANITGIDLYSHIYGEPGESIARFE